MEGVEFELRRRDTYLGISLYHTLVVLWVGHSTSSKGSLAFRGWLITFLSSQGTDEEIIPMVSSGDFTDQIVLVDLSVGSHS